jgi:hypothetical protein
MVYHYAAVLIAPKWLRHWARVRPGGTLLQCF